MTLWRQLRSILALPGLVAVVIPAIIVARSGGVSVGWGLPRPWRWLPPAGGALLIGGGLALVAQTVRLFATRGQGTLAPWEPPRRLVVDGVYRRVRNPMICGVGVILLGESLLLGVRPLFGWFLGFAAVNAIYMPLLEEPQLAARFGDDYQAYCRNVPRWIPRARPWQPPWDGSGGA